MDINTIYTSQKSHILQNQNDAPRSLYDFLRSSFMIHHYFGYLTFTAQILQNGKICFNMMENQ